MTEQRQQIVDAALRAFRSEIDAERALGIPEDCLRAHIGSVSDADLLHIENRIQAEFTMEIAEREMDLIAARAAADQFKSACKQRRFAIWRADRDRHLSECDAIVQEMYEWSVFVGDIEEAA